VLDAKLQVVTENESFAKANKPSPLLLLCFMNNAQKFAVAASAEMWECALKHDGDGTGRWNQILISNSLCCLLLAASAVMHGLEVQLESAAWPNINQQQASSTCQAS